MSLFDDMLKSPLPSAMYESDDDDYGFDDMKSGTSFDDDNPDYAGETAELNDEESQNVDAVINSVATPILISQELNDEEVKEFVEGVDGAIAEAEGFITEKTIVKFDKNAKKAQLFEIALAAVAREKKDPLYRKLETVYKMERILKAKLRKKYRSQATAKMKEYLSRARKSKSGILARIASKLSK